MTNTTVLQQDIIQQLQKLNNREKAFRSISEIGNNWSEINTCLSRKAQKYRDSARAFTFIAGFCLAVTGMVSLAVTFGYPLLPEPRSGGLFIFLTLCNVNSAYLHRLRLQKLEQQLALMDLLKATAKTSA